MSYYYTCPTCGANLDPGERCEDCYPKTKTTLNNIKEDKNYVRNQCKHQHHRIEESA